MKIKKRNRKCSYNWSPAKERLIIDLWKSNFNEFQSQPRRHEQIYEKISFQLADCGVMASKIEVKNKIKNLFQKYKTEKSLKTSMWPQFDILDSFLYLIFKDKGGGPPAIIDDQKLPICEANSIIYDDSITEPIIKTEIDEDEYDDELNSSTDMHISSYLPEISVHKSPGPNIRSRLRNLPENRLHLPPDPPPPPPSLIPLNRDYSSNPHHHLGLMRTNMQHPPVATLPTMATLPIVSAEEKHVAATSTTHTRTSSPNGLSEDDDEENGENDGRFDGGDIVTTRQEAEEADRCRHSTRLDDSSSNRINFKLEILNELKKMNSLAELEYHKQMGYMERANELNERSIQALEKSNDIQEKILNFLVNKF